MASIISALKSTQSRTGAEAICQAICAGPKIDPGRIEVVSFITVRSEQAINSGNGPKGILAVFEFQAQEVSYTDAFKV